MKFIRILFAEPIGYHFGTKNGLGLVEWRNAAAADDDDGDAVESDMDKIAFGFMTWQPNATLLHYASESTGDKLDIKLVSSFFSNFTNTIQFYRCLLNLAVPIMFLNVDSKVIYCLP